MDENKIDEIEELEVENEEYIDIPIETEEIPEIEDPEDREYEVVEIEEEGGK